MSDIAAPLEIGIDRQAIHRWEAFPILVSCMLQIWLVLTHRQQFGWLAMLILSAAMAIAVVRTLRDKAPRIVIGDDGVRWREHPGAAFQFLAWDQIAAADTDAIGDDGPLLRLRERNASPEQSSKPVLIPIRRLATSPDALAAEIHRRAPHLCMRASRAKA